MFSFTMANMYIYILIDICLYSFTMSMYTYTNKTCLYSYNSRGFSGARQDLCKILKCMKGDNLPILCNQENVLLKNNSYKIGQCLAK